MIVSGFILYVDIILTRCTSGPVDLFSNGCHWIHFLMVVSGFIFSGYERIHLIQYYPMYFWLSKCWLDALLSRWIYFIWLSTDFIFNGFMFTDPMHCGQHTRSSLFRLLTFNYARGIRNFFIDDLAASTSATKKLLQGSRWKNSSNKEDEKIEMKKSSSPLTGHLFQSHTPWKITLGNLMKKFFKERRRKNRDGKIFESADLSFIPIDNTGGVPTTIYKNPIHSAIVSRPRKI
jgi:hypothetical protein